jgi:hypothetical protein
VASARASTHTHVHEQQTHTHTRSRESENPLDGGDDLPSCIYTTHVCRAQPAVSPLGRTFGRLSAGGLLHTHTQMGKFSLRQYLLSDVVVLIICMCSSSLLPHKSTWPRGLFSCAHTHTHTHIYVLYGQNYSHAFQPPSTQYVHTHTRARARTKGLHHALVLTIILCARFYLFSL